MLDILQTDTSVTLQTRSVTLSGSVSGDSVSATAGADTTLSR
ncbi:MAG: hypothetical protein U5O39_11880 [Gammaproteobacteria bacterium]|nr:hypothetical protein [Gammaproteobacteria bacterium]